MNTVEAPATVAPMPPRKRPLDRKNRRVTIEVYEEEEETIHRFRMAALAARMTLREWLIQAGVEKVEREP